MNPARHRRAVVAGVALLLVIACGGSQRPGRTPSGGYVSCNADGDCEITTFAGCCACCPAEPHAVPKGKLEQQKQRCAGADCATCSERIDCPKSPGVAAFTPRCKDG